MVEWTGFGERGIEMDIEKICTTIVLILMILIIYYMSVAQTKKQNKELKKLQNNLKKGDKVITYSGLSGIIEKIEEDRVILKTYPDNVKISVEKWAVAGLDDREVK